MIRQHCEVLTNKRAGAYHAVTLVAPDIAERARPGQFVEVGMPDRRDFLLRRPMSIHQASRRGGWAGTLEVVFDVNGPGTEWLAEVRPHQTVDLIGPLGRPFKIPRYQTSCVLVGGGYGAAPLYFLAEELRAHAKTVSMVIGAREHDRVFRPVEAKRLSDTLVITTEDGSTGHPGRVTDVLASVVERARGQAVYACGPNAMLRAVAEFCMEARLPCQVAVEEMMACGLGVCWTCVVPVIGQDGAGWWNMRSCVEGPVFNGARVWWDEWLGPTVEPDLPEGSEEGPAEEVADLGADSPADERPPVEAGQR